MLLSYMHNTRLFVLLCMCPVVVGLLDIKSSAKVGRPENVPGKFAWVSHVAISPLPGSVVLVLLLNVDYRANEPCGEFSPLCCLGLQLRKHVWGGDIDVLDTVRNLCEAGVGDPWERVFAPLSVRYGTDVEFSLSDLRDPERGGYAISGVHDIRMLTLVIETWTGCDNNINANCVVRLQGVEQIMRVDTSSAHQISTVSLPTHCTLDKPLNSFWVPSSNYTACEWFCDEGFARCPGHGTGSVAAACHMLPLTGAELRVSAALTLVLNKRDDQLLDTLSATVARRLTEAGVVGVEECAVIVHNNMDAVSLLGRVDLPLVQGRIRVNAETHYDGVVLRDATSTDVPNEPIAIELDDVDDRLLPGFFDITLLVYSNNTSFSLAQQAVLLRYVLFDTLRLIPGSGVVLYVSDVKGVMHGAVFPESILTFTHVVLLFVWAAVIVFLSVISMLCPWHFTSGTNVLLSPDSQTQFDSVLPPAKLWSDHSPKNRVFLAVVSIFIVSTIPATVFLYIFVIIPRISSMNDPFLMLGWLWCMFIVCIIAIVVCCCIATRLHRFQVWLGL
jgi:hypothetical protein